jgi:AmmeMemoRadiSam system protein B
VFVDELAEKLAEVYDKNTLIVASSDLSHFYTREQANKLDTIVAERITAFEYDRLQSDLEDRNCEACGGGAIVALMKAAAKLNKTNSKVIHRSDSGDTSGDTSEVVGYLSAVIY